LGKGDPIKRGGERGAPLFKKRYFTAIGSSNVKMVADRHRHAAYHNKPWRHAFQEWIMPKWLEIDQNNLCRKFPALNLYF